MAISPDICPMLKPGVKVERLPLSPAEGFVLSRVNGITPVREIAASTGLPLAQVEEALSKLHSLGAIDWQKVEAAAPRARASQPAAKAEVKAPAGPDLNHILERVVLMFRSLGRADHYKLLGVPRTADEEAIKTAYAQLSREIHPDRFFNIPLGEKKDMLDTVFAKISLAYETLRDSARRAAYDVSLLPPELRSKVQDQAAAKKGITADAGRIVELAEQELRNGNYKSALQNFRIAVSLSPGDFQLAKRAAFVEGIQTLTGSLEKVMSDPKGAELLGDKVIKSLLAKVKNDKDLFPPDEKLIGVTVKFLLYFDSDKLVAREMAERLVKRTPRAQSFVVLAKVALAEGNQQEALKLFEKALALDSRNIEAKNGLQDLKRK